MNHGTKTLKSMPDIWDDEPYYTSGNTVLGHFASWAVQQSPYLVPDNFARALTELERALRVLKASWPGVFQTTYVQLCELVREAFDTCPTVWKWNRPKSGGNPVAALSSGHDKPDPDNDIIDLDALAVNVAQSVTVAEKYGQLPDREDQMKTVMHIAGTEAADLSSWPFTVEPVLDTEVRIKGVDYRVSGITLVTDEYGQANPGQRIVELIRIADAFPTPDEIVKEEEPSA